MGGCRCYFRDCKVSTSRNPGMHFFRFPKRACYLDDWIRFAGLENYLNLADSQQRNKVICGRHFKDTCFMNYKQERLITTAVPTLTRLNQEWALDYEKDLQNPNLIKIEVPSAKHLIAPPEFKDPQCFNRDDLKLAADILALYKHTKNADNSEEEPLSKHIKLTEGTRTTNEQAKGFLENLAYDETCETTSIEGDFEGEMSFNFECSSTSTHQNKKIETTTYSLAANKRIEELEALLAIKNEELNDLSVKLKSRDVQLHNECQHLKTVVESSLKLRSQLKRENQINQQLRNEIKNFNTKHNELQSAYNELLRQHETLETCFTNQETNELKVSKDETPESQRHVGQPQRQLSKQQLFNGIKRYLSQTMIALLRMQLSACGTERDWKSDERRVASDLLSLGEPVYKYFTDEWLIRLPSINTVVGFRNKNEQQQDEDDL